MWSIYQIHNNLIACHFKLNPWSFIYCLNSVLTGMLHWMTIYWEMKHIFLLIMSFRMKKVDVILLGSFIYLSHTGYLSANLSYPVQTIPPWVQLLHSHFVLTLHSYIHFINSGSEEMWIKILDNIAEQMQRPIHDFILDIWWFYCRCWFALMSLCFSAVMDWTFSQIGPLCTAGLKLVHFNGAHWEPHETYMVKLTCCTGGPRTAYWKRTVMSCKYVHFI